MRYQIYQNTVLSPHATKRIQQRGIKMKYVQLIFEYADREISVGKGCTSLSVSKSWLNKLVKMGCIGRQMAEKIIKFVIVLVDDNGIRVIKTVMRAQHIKGRHHTKSVKRKFNRGNKYNSTRRN